MHGGRTPNGFALPQTTHARYSGSLPTKLATRYREAQTDPELLSHREEVALLSMFMEERLTNLHAESAELWQRATKLFEEWKVAPADKAYDVQTALGEVLLMGSAEAGNRAEVVTLAEHRRRHSESEQKRLATMNQLVPVEQALLFIGAVMETVRRHVGDRNTLSAIGEDLRRLSERDVSGG